jgi:hypothetical protein
MKYCDNCPYQPLGCKIMCQQQHGLMWPSAEEVVALVRERKPVTLAGVVYVPAQQEPNEIDRLILDIIRLVIKLNGQQ